MNPYRVNARPKPPACVDCEGACGHSEWTGMGSEWEECCRCHGTGVEPWVFDGVAHMPDYVDRTKIRNGHTDWPGIETLEGESR